MATLLQSPWTLDPGLSALRSAAVSPSGRLLVTYGSVGLSYVISVWDVGTREELTPPDPLQWLQPERAISQRRHQPASPWV